ncbi:MAG: hypothetical protein ACE5LC_07580 [Candidatus Aminicenantales bacterium]
MKKFAFLFLLVLVASSLSAQEFGYPLNLEPWYYIKIKLPLEQKSMDGKWELSRVEVNSEEVRDFILSHKGKEIFKPLLASEGPYELKVRYSWQPEKKYELRAYLKNTHTEQEICLEETAFSPPGRGYWNPLWKNYLVLQVAEENGCWRKNLPLHATFGVLSSCLRSPQEIRVVKAEKKGKDVSYTEIPSQVYDVIRWEDEKLLQKKEVDEETGKAITRYHPTTTLSIAFEAHLRPYEKASYIVFYNNPSAGKPSYPTDLSVSGEGLAKTVENPFYRVVLHQKSGMVHEVYEKSTNTKLEHKLETNGSIHWNPGVYSPPHSWSHCSDWENPSFSEIKGPVFYSLRRQAPLPHLQDVQASITYYFYSGAPFIIMESTLQVNDDIFVKALRNAEVVFNREVFTRAVYRTARGRVKSIDFARSRRHPQHAAVLRPDTPWVCFYDDHRQVGFATLFLENFTTNIYAGSASSQQPYIYIQHGPWYYLSRAFVYSFGSNNQTRMLPVRKGSVYFERNAWIPLAFRARRAVVKTLDEYFSMIKYPLKIMENIETYPESPRGWLVPILTEPFDEGVKKAIGIRKR